MKLLALRRSELCVVTALVAVWALDPGYRAHAAAAPCPSDQAKPALNTLKEHSQRLLELTTRDPVREKGYSHELFELAVEYSKTCLMTPEETRQLHRRRLESTDYKKFQEVRQKFNAVVKSLKSADKQEQAVAQKAYGPLLEELRRLNQKVNNAYDEGFKARWYETVKSRPPKFQVEDDKGITRNLMIEGRAATSDDLRVIALLASAIRHETESCEFQLLPPEVRVGHMNLAARVLYDRRMLIKRVEQAAPGEVNRLQAALHEVFGRADLGSYKGGAAFEQAVTAASQIHAGNIFASPNSTKMNPVLPRFLCPEVPDNKSKWGNKTIDPRSEEFLRDSVAYALYYYSLTDKDEKWYREILQKQKEQGFVKVRREDEIIPLFRLGEDEDVGKIIPRVFFYTHGVKLPGGKQIHDFTLGKMKLKGAPNCAQPRIWFTKSTREGLETDITEVQKPPLAPSP